MFKFNPKNDSRLIDPCMKNVMEFLNCYDIDTLACCCGHGKYPPTIVVEHDEMIMEIFSGEVIPRKKKFYRRDKQGVYYIPETIKEVKKT